MRKKFVQVHLFRSISILAFRHAEMLGEELVHARDAHVDMMRTCKALRVDMDSTKKRGFAAASLSS